MLTCSNDNFEVLIIISMELIILQLDMKVRGAGGGGTFQVVLVVKNPPANAGDVGDESLIPGLGESPRGGLGNPLQYSCLENPMDRGSWQTTVHRFTQSRRLKKGSLGGRRKEEK